MSYTFAKMLDRDTIIPRDDIRTNLPHLRHVEIARPGANSHRRAGQIYLQPAEGAQ